MYDINLKNVKKGKGFHRGFLFVGILFFAIMVGVLVSNILREKKMDAEVMSSRVEIRESRDSDGTMYSPVYYYEVDGIEYECTSSASSSSRPSTENKKIKFESEQPSSCFSPYDKSSNTLIIIFLIIPIVFILIGIFNINKINKKIKMIKELNNTGKLVKNLPYRMETSGMRVNNVDILKPVVDYKLPNGTILQLTGDPRHDRKNQDADGMVDLIIDENNPDNYFIDFEINRLSGNLPGDYYVDQTIQQPMMQQPMMPNQPMMPTDPYGQMQQPMMPNQQMMPTDPYGQMQQPMMPNQPMMPQQPMNNGQYPNQNNMQ